MLDILKIGIFICNSSVHQKIGCHSSNDKNYNIQIVVLEYQECKKRLDVFSNDSSLCSDSELRDAYLAISEFARSEDYSGVMAILRSLEQYDLMGDDEIIIQKIKDAMDDMDYYAACNIIEKIL